MEDFYKDMNEALNDLNQLHQHLVDNQQVRVSEIDRALNTSVDMNESTRMLVHSVVESGSRITFIINIINLNRKKYFRPFCNQRLCCFFITTERANYYLAKNQIIENQKV